MQRGKSVAWILEGQLVTLLRTNRATVVSLSYQVIPPTPSRSSLEPGQVNDLLF